MRERFLPGEIIIKNGKLPLMIVIEDSAEGGLRAKFFSVGDGRWYEDPVVTGDVIGASPFEIAKFLNREERQEAERLRNQWVKWVTRPLRESESLTVPSTTALPIRGQGEIFQLEDGDLLWVQIPEDTAPEARDRIARQHRMALSMMGFPNVRLIVSPHPVTVIRPPKGGPEGGDI